MTVVRIPLIASSDAEGEVNQQITTGELTQNVLFSKYSNGQTYATQRPGLSTFITDPDNISANLARGAFYWEVTDASYIVANNKVFKGDYTNQIATIVGGKERCYFIPFSPEILILFDPSNNDAWLIDEFDTLTQVGTEDVPGEYEWPGNIAGVQLVGGGAYLDGYFFVMDSQGRIYNSDLVQGPGYWPVLSYLTAEREPDRGLFLTKHHEHLVAIGTNTIEFFSDVGNALGSPLQRRADISYRVGAFSEAAVFNSGDSIYFVGSEYTGTLGVFQIKGFKLSKVSKDSQDSYINKTLIRDIGSDGEVLASGGPIGEHSDITYFTFAGGTTRYNPVYTLVYDATTETWGNWTTQGDPYFPVIAVTTTFGGTVRNQSLLFLDGTVAEFQLQGAAVDGFGNSPYVVDDYVDRISPDDDSYSLDNYIEDVDVGTGTNIDMIIRVPEYDGGTMTNKFCHKFELVGSPLNAPEFSYLQDPVKVRWSDDHYATWKPDPLIDGYRDLFLHGDRWKLTRLGKFNRRSFEVSYSGRQQLRLEAVELDIRAAQYA